MRTTHGAHLDHFNAGLGLAGDAGSLTTICLEHLLMDSDAFVGEEGTMFVSWSAKGHSLLHGKTLNEFFFKTALTMRLTTLT